MTRRGVSLVVFVALLAGCGVPAEDAPRAVPPPPGPPPAAATGSATAPAGRVAEVLCLVRDDHLVPVVRRVDTEPTLDTQLKHLLAGPTSAERDIGLTSALPGAVTVTTVRLTGEQADIDVGDTGEGTGRSDEILPFGQIVCTLTARGDVSSVAFRRRGQPLGVPRADGSLSQQPLTAGDYAALTAPG